MVAAGLSSTRWLVPSLSLAVFVNAVGAYALIPFIPTVADELGVSVALLGQVPALMLLLAAVLGLVVGPFADRYGYRRMLLLGLLAVLTSSLVTGLATTFLILLLVSIVGALGRSTVLPVAQAIVATRLTDDSVRRAALSQIQTGQAVAALIGLPLLTTLAGLLTWRGAYFALAVLALLVALAITRLLPTDGREPGRSIQLRDMLAAYRPLLQHRPSLALILSSGIDKAGIWVVFTYVAAFYVHQHGFTTQEVGWVYLAIGIGALVGQLLPGGPLGARPRPLVIASRAGCGCLLGAALLLPLPALVTVALITLAFIAQCMSTVGTVILLSGVAPTGRATALTLNASSMSLGSALGGALGGLLLTVGGYATLGAGSLVLVLLAAGVVGWSRSHDRSPAAPPALIPS